MAVLDVGCAVGGSSFEFSATAGRTLGIDFSRRFVEAAEALRAGGTLPFSYTVEGELQATATARLPASARSDRVRFLTGDACAMPAAVAAGGPYHIIHGANLLCRLPDPAAFLAQLPALLARDGVIVFISPYSWLPAYTARDRWLGGKVGRTGAAAWSRDGLADAMRELGFDLAHEEDVPFLIREHARKFQWGCSHLTVFKWAM